LLPRKMRPSYASKPEVIRLPFGYTNLKIWRTAGPDLATIFCTRTPNLSSENGPSTSSLRVTAPGRRCANRYHVGQFAKDAQIPTGHEARSGKKRYIPPPLGLLAERHGPARSWSVESSTTRRRGKCWTRVLGHDLRDDPRFGSGQQSVGDGNDMRHTSHPRHTTCMPRSL